MSGSLLIKTPGSGAEMCKTPLKACSVEVRNSCKSRDGDFIYPVETADLDVMSNAVMLPSRCLLRCHAAITFPSKFLVLNLSSY